MEGGGLFDKWGCDIVGPLPRSKRGNLYIIVASEYKWRFGVATPVPVANRFEVAEFPLKEIVLKYGAPKTLITDRGSRFKSNMPRILNSLM